MREKANIRFQSNVFPVSGVVETSVPGLPARYSGVFNDPLFRRQIRGKAALKKLAEAKCGSSIYERDLRAALAEASLVEEWQIDIYWDKQGSGGCSDCPRGARPFGIVHRDGCVTVEN